MEVSTPGSQQVHVYPDQLYVRRKGVDRRYGHGTSGYVEPDVNGDYWYAHLAAIGGYDGLIKPKCIILGDPEIMRIYPNPKGTVFIDRSKLGDWGTKGNHIPIEGVGWWGMIKEFIAPPAIPPQRQGSEQGLERCRAMKTRGGRV